MSKIYDVKESDGTIKHMFVCLACGCCHFFIEPKWGWNQDREKPTVTGSVLVRHHRNDKDIVCHSFVKDGKIEYLGDCTHEKKGLTEEIIDFDAWIQAPDFFKD